MKNDNLAAIGIGAMIVFIALILVAAVAAAVIIQTAEKLQQNAQSTGDDTTDEMSGKVQVLNVFVADDSHFEVYFRLAAGSDDTADTDILFQIFCDDGAGGMDRISGDFGDSQIDPLSGAAAVTDVAAGTGYRTTVSADDGTGDCGPNALFHEQRQGNALPPRRWRWNNLRRSQGQRRFCWSSGGLSLPVQ